MGLRDGRRQRENMFGKCSNSRNFLKVGYIEDYIGDYSMGYYTPGN